MKDFDDIKGAQYNDKNKKKITHSESVKTDILTFTYDLIFSIILHT
jgi:hypothetical protein